MVLLWWSSTIALTLRLYDYNGTHNTGFLLKIYTKTCSTHTNNVLYDIIFKFMISILSSCQYMVSCYYANNWICKHHDCKKKLQRQEIALKNGEWLKVLNINILSTWLNQNICIEQEIINLTTNRCKKIGYLNTSLYFLMFCL